MVGEHSSGRKQMKNFFSSFQESLTTRLTLQITRSLLCSHEGFFILQNIKINILVLFHQVKSSLQPSACHTVTCALYCRWWCNASEIQQAPDTILDSLGKVPNLFLQFSFVLILPKPKHIVLTVYVSLAPTNLPWIEKNHVSTFTIWCGCPMKIKAKPQDGVSSNHPPKLCWLWQKTALKGSAEEPNTHHGTKTN